MLHGHTLLMQRNPSSNKIAWWRVFLVARLPWINADVYKYAKRHEMFFAMSLRLSDHKVLHNIASSSSFFFDFARIFSLFSLVFRTSNFWSLRNFIKQLFHSRLLDMRLVIANSALRASLAIYHLISNARSWNNC